MPYLLKKPSADDKLQILGRTAEFDVCGLPRIFTQKSKKFQRFKFIYPAVGKGGRCVWLFKVLQTNYCEGNCYYCANRKDRNFIRTSFSPAELARLFIKYHQSGQADGFFLSSAIYDSVKKTQEQMFKTLWLIRKKYHYEGYIHFKILPGSEDSLIEKSAKLADRVSVNLEAPSSFYLSRLSPTKDFQKQLFSTLQKISRISKKIPLKAGITTQLVVGAAGESDREILSLSYQLYKKYKLWRVYYSGFIPLKDTPLENNSPCLPLREFRLYQADFLLRGYGFTPEELPFGKEGFLPLDRDPKLAWAFSHPEKFPLEVNKASYQELLRVPGIGKISAKRIIETRSKGKITSLDELKATGCVVKRARNFLTINGKFYPSSSQIKEEESTQLFLWEEI